MRNRKPRNLVRCCLAKYLATVCICLATLLALLQETHAQSHVFHIDWSKPQPNYPIGVGVPVQPSCPVRISMQMSHTAPTAACYHPMRFQVRPIGRTFPTDGTVTVRVTYREYGLWDEHVAVLTTPVRAGDTVAESEMLVRRGPSQGPLSIEGAWNGRAFASLSSQAYFAWSSSDGQPTRLDLVSSRSIMNKTDLMRRAFDSLDGSGMTLAIVADPSLSIGNQNSRGFANCVADVSRLPSNWLELAHIDEITATLEDLQTMDDAGRQVLRRYIWCGGRLRIENAKAPNEVRDLMAADWDRTITSMPIQGQGYRAGLGLVVLGKYKDDSEDFLNEMTYDRARLFRFEKNLADDYWKWLIPEVGKTPIWTFLGIVALLVGIGAPSILLWSQRIQRRVWTILAIPVLSLASVLSLFFYATVKDGWRSLVRIRSVTTLDSEGNGAVWSRQTYFAGNIPEGRIRVGAQTELIPLYTTKPPNTVQYQDVTGEKQIHSGILTARQQKQVSISHWVDDVQILQWSGGTDPATGMPTTKNGYPSKIIALVCSDPSGRVFQAENVAPEEIVSWQETDAENAARWLKRCYDAESLAIPPDAPDSNSSSLFQEFWLPRLWPVPRVSTSNMEEEEYWTEELATWGPDVRRKFIALVDRAPHLEKCLENAKETSSLHMIIGRWKLPARDGSSKPSPSTTDSEGKGLQREGFGEE
jgi:hypothetical protein